MSFYEVLNEYIDIIGCSARELALVSGISPTVLSRYRKGERIPKYDSKQLDLLIIGLVTLAKYKNIKELNEQIIRNKFDEVLNKNTIDFEVFRNNLNILINSLNINAADISRYIGFDASYLSKIRSGVRKPQDIVDFVNSISKYIVNNYSDSISKNNVASIIDCNINNILDSNSYFDTLKKWISNNTSTGDNGINNFLWKIHYLNI